MILNRATVITLVTSLWVLLVPSLTGIFRTALEIPIEGASALAVVIVFCASLFSFSQIKDFRIGANSLFLASTVLLSFFFVFRMYHPAFAGLPSVGGGDTGNHLHWGRLFTNQDPNIYHGFVVFYSLTYWLSLLGITDYFEIFRTSFYLYGLLSVIAICAFASRLAWQNNKKHLFIFTITLALLSYFPLERIFFPLLHYLQAEGFYPQLIATPILIIALATYSLSSKLVTRLSLLIGSIAIYRFTYGLNLGDLLSATALLAFSESLVRNKNREKQALRLLAVACLCAALYCYWSLSSVLHLVGAVVRISLPISSAGVLVLCTSCVLGLLSLRRAQENCSELSRALSFSACFGLSGLIFQIYGGSIVQDNAYYLQKYSYHAMLVISCTSVICFASFFTIQMASRKLNNVFNTVFFTYACSTFVGLWLINTALQPIRVSYQQRAEHMAYPNTLEPLVDLATWETIKKTLKVSNSKFGGYLTPSWPQSNFTNAAFDFYGELPLYREGKVKDKPGYCIFWQSSSTDLALYQRAGGKKLVDKIKQLEAQPDIVRISYAAPWSKEPKELSLHCKRQ